MGLRLGQGGSVRHCYCLESALSSYCSVFSSRIIMSNRKNAFGSFLLRSSVLLQGLGVGSSALLPPIGALLMRVGGGVQPTLA